VKVNGRLCYLWRAVDHEGEVLEAVVTAKRDESAALKFLKRIMKRYGRPWKIVTDGLCSYPAAMNEIGNAAATRSVVGSTIAWRIRISRFDDENGPCSGFEA
jgi:putative transposase